MTTAQSLIKYVSDVWLNGDASGLDEHVPIIELNIIDSAEIFDLVHYLQSEFRIAIPLREVSPVNFRNIAAIAALVERLQADGEPVR